MNLQLHSAIHLETPSWQKALIQAITDPAELFDLLELNKNLLEKAYQAAKLFPLRVPRGYVALIEKGNPNDPLLRQILPLEEEFLDDVNFIKDPLQEQSVIKIPGLLHKYHGRVLITAVGSCAINCRYCFRRHFPYAENNPGKKGWTKILDYINANQSLSEVILSGGDPLLANDDYLKNIIEQLGEIKHLKRLRIHSRLPIVVPERITANLLNIITNSRLPTILVIHCNHPNEIDHRVADSIVQLKNKNITLLNQAVLLKGVNDSLETLINLQESLFSLGVLPYYLHQLDKVQGTTHFEVNEDRAKQLYQGLLNHLPGYLVPKFAYEQPGALAKTAIF